jgi:pantoate--beta-alanine ligase|tara:strand:+ start:2011 stop:2859 length:849 start_codon:yes stop_codon:yes gene_type:complete
MKVFKTKTELKTYFKEIRSENDKIGFVPTMGALHQGHLSLIKQSKENNHFTIASIFVNPTQFDKKEDLDNYPKTLESDLDLLEKAACDIVFAPSIEEIYHDNIVSIHFDFDGLENEMEGKYRAGHFNGVGTIVKTLFEIIAPTNAYFGEKDFQQLQIVRKMVKKSKLNVSVIGCPIYREESGLAMSSRNKRLSEKEKKAASIIYKVLKKVVEKSSSETISDIEQWVSVEFKNHPLFDLEYFTIADIETLKTVSKLSPNSQYRAFIAVYANTVRLIDNISINT